MSYEKNTWSNGDVITAEKLNHVEDGIQEIDMNNEPLYATVTLYSLNPKTYSCDKNFLQILNAIRAGRNVYVAVIDYGEEIAHFSRIDGSLGGTETPNWIKFSAIYEEDETFYYIKVTFLKNNNVTVEAYEV